MRRLIPILALALLSGARPAAAQTDPVPILREVVRKVHTGLVAQARAPWTPDGPRLLVDPAPFGGGEPWSADSLLPRDVRDDDVALVLCAAECRPSRPAEIRIAFAAPRFRGDRHAEVEVEATGVHRRDGDVPQHPWRTTTRYRLERHGGEWVVVGSEPVRGS